MEKIRGITLQIDEEYIDKLKKIAVENDSSISEILKKEVLRVIDAKEVEDKLNIDPDDPFAGI